MGVIGEEEDNADGKIPVEGAFGDAVTEGNHFRMEKLETLCRRLLFFTKFTSDTIKNV